VTGIDLVETHAGQQFVVLSLPSADHGGKIDTVRNGMRTGCVLTCLDATIDLWKEDSLARTPLRADDPTRIGHYRLTARLGSGGMGVVYLGVAWDGSQVAVKVLRPDLADDQEFRRRFGREVAALVRVKSECTVRVIEADSQSSRPFVVTEYAEGPSLAEHIDTYGSVSPDMLYGLATGLAEALTVIHAAAITHRDLKPSNIILTDAGPKVIDFGVARRKDTTAMTKTGMMVGSMGFMAPEQISGRPGPAADIFAWGVTVAYAAAGRSPFGAGNAHAILYRIMYGDPDIAAVPEPLRPLVEAALTKDPQSRPTAQMLLDRLTSASKRPERVDETPTQVILAQTWQTGLPNPPAANRANEANGSLRLEPAPPGGAPPGAAPAVADQEGPGQPSHGDDSRVGDRARGRRRDAHQLQLVARLAPLARLLGWGRQNDRPR
jgi:serine/threonine protein kinase